MNKSPTSTVSRLPMATDKHNVNKTKSACTDGPAPKAKQDHDTKNEFNTPTIHQKLTNTLNPTINILKDYDYRPTRNPSSFSTTHNPHHSNTINASQVSPDVMTLPICKINKFARAPSPNTPLPSPINTTGQASLAVTVTASAYSGREGMHCLDYKPTNRLGTSESKAIMKSGDCSSAAVSILPRVEQNKCTTDTVVNRSSNLGIDENSYKYPGIFYDNTNSHATNNQGSIHENQVLSFQEYSGSPAFHLPDRSCTTKFSYSPTFNDEETGISSYNLPQSSPFMRSLDDNNSNRNGVALSSNFSLQPRRFSSKGSFEGSQNDMYLESPSKPLHDWNDGTHSSSSLQRSLTTAKLSSSSKSIHTTPVRSTVHCHQHNSNIDNKNTQKQQGKYPPSFVHMKSHSISESSSGVTPRTTNSMKSKRTSASGGGSPSTSCKSPTSHSAAAIGSGQVTNATARTNPEILKTLLRKKACLYEVDTSKAIALITWIVGRYLGIKFGYFSRQQLQSGVHNIVADKIESGLVTRTKVNRCMQIILNSCFHYIIPRPDGMETGDSFRLNFTSSSYDDAYLIDTLAEPWNEIDIKAALRSLDSCEEVQSNYVDINSDEPPASCDASDGTDGSKRMVLLCFNDNVRCFEDVFRCHNEFIRDTANSSNVHLTAEEWQTFFVGPDPKAVLQTDSYSTIVLAEPFVAFHKQDKREPASSVSLPTGFEHRQTTEEKFLFEKGMGHRRKTSRGNLSIAGIENEILGQMSTIELCRFRTSWCAKRYDHDPILCAFGHVDVNKGWLRRDPSDYGYIDMMCPHILLSSRLEGYTFNTCPDGIFCSYAHSKEECLYHPQRYKTIQCKNGPTSCCLKEICPNVHVQTSQPRNTIHEGKITPRTCNSSPSSPRHSPLSSPHKVPVPSAPMLYIFPSPESDFEKDMLWLPGLKDLFRQRSATLYANCQGQAQTKYNMFGDLHGRSISQMLHI